MNRRKALTRLAALLAAPLVALRAWVADNDNWHNWRRHIWLSDPPPTLKPLPPFMYREREKLLEIFRQITSLYAHEVPQGQAPAGDDAGRAFLVLQEADDTDLGPLTEWSWKTRMPSPLERSDAS